MFTCQQNKITRNLTKQKISSFKGKKKKRILFLNKFTLRDLLVHFKITILKVYKKVKQDVQDVNKMVYEQNGNIGNEMENLKKTIWK